MTTITQQESEVRWDDVLDGMPAQVWDAITVHSDGWLWPITNEPYVAHFAGRDARYEAVEIVRHRFDTTTDAVWLDAVIADA